MLESLEAARQAARAEPRETVSLSTAHSLMVQVAEDLRFERLQERLRSGEPLVVTSNTAGMRTGWTALVYWVKRQLFRPVYFWALRSGLDPVVPFANRAYRMLSWLLK
jgi:hypothetical protein